MGAQDVGVLHVRTGDDADESMIGEDFTVARVKRRMLQQSYLGAIYTRRDAAAMASTRATPSGVDLRLATSRFLGSQNLSATGWALHAARPGVSSRNNAFGVFIDYPNDLWSGRLGLREVQAGLRSDSRLRHAHRIPPLRAVAGVRAAAAGPSLHPPVRVRRLTSSS